MLIALPVLLGLVVVGVVRAEFDGTSPEEVVNVTAEPSAEQVVLHWDTGIDDTAVVQYKVYYGTESVNKDGGYYQKEILTGNTDTEYVLSDLVPEVEHYFAVTALDAEGNESLTYSIEVSAVPQSVEAEEVAVEIIDETEVVLKETEEDSEESVAETEQVSMLEVTSPVISDLQVESAIEQASLSWTLENSNQNIVGYRVYYGTDPLAKTDYVETTETNCTLDGLEGNTTYYITVAVLDRKSKEVAMSEQISVLVEAASVIQSVPEEEEEMETPEDSMPATGAALIVPAALALGIAGAVRRSTKKIK